MLSSQFCHHCFILAARFNPIDHELAPILSSLPLFELQVHCEFIMEYFHQHLFESKELLVE
jgi:hypothetical protein